MCNKVYSVAKPIDGQRFERLFVTLDNVKFGIIDISVYIDGLHDHKQNSLQKSEQEQK